MLKLMKYEFRKTRTVLVVLLIAFAALQLGFVAGIRADRPRLYIPASMLTAFLVYGAYVYILLSGIVSYSRELRDRTGYLVFLVPVHPFGVVLSKLLFTLLAAVAATAVFGAGAYLDYVGLFRRLSIDPALLQKIDLSMFLPMVGESLPLGQIAMMALTVLATLLIRLMTTACTAFLAITLSATLMQNRKGFLRGLLSFLFFFLLVWGAQALEDALLGPLTRAASMSAMLRRLGASLAVNLAFCGLFAWLSAWLLDRRVNL